MHQFKFEPKQCHIIEQYDLSVQTGGMTANIFQNPTNLSWQEGSIQVRTHSILAGMSAPPLIHEAGGGGSVDWINPDLLEEECEDSHCALCLGVMVKAVSGCPEGHSFCRVCLSKALVHDDRCPTCRWAPVQKESLVANRTTDNLIAKLAIRCENAPKENLEGVGPPTAKRARVAPKTMQALRDALASRGLDSKGNKTDLVARLEEDRKQVCMWTGCIGKLTGHRVECAWATIKCPYKGCMESPLLSGLATHKSTCGSRNFKCE